MIETPFKISLAILIMNNDQALILNKHTINTYEPQCDSQEILSNLYHTGEQLAHILNTPLQVIECDHQKYGEDWTWCDVICAELL